MQRGARWSREVRSLRDFSTTSGLRTPSLIKAGYTRTNAPKSPIQDKQKGGNQSLVGVDNNNTLIGDVDFIIGSDSEVSLVGSTSPATLPLPAKATNS